MSSGTQERVGLLSIALLFPGFLFYHFGVANGVFAPVLGGYFGIVTILLLPFLLLPFVLRMLSGGLSTFEWSVLLFFAYCMLWAAIHAVAGSYYQSGLALFFENLAYLILLTGLFLAARLFPVSAVRPVSMMTILFVGMAAVVIANIGENLLIQVIANSMQNDDGVSSYQGFARSVLVIGVLMLCGLRGVLLLASVAVTLGMLLFIGARSEFAGYLIVCLAMLPVWLKLSRRVLLGAGLLVAAIAIIFVFTEFSLETFRIRELLDLERSTSFRSRREFTLGAIETISQSPVLGEYGSDDHGYAHNALSAWVTYGLLGMVLYVGLIVFAIGGAVRRILLAPTSASPTAIAAYCFGVYSLVMVIFAKHISDPVIALGWGFYAAAVAEQDRIS